MARYIAEQTHIRAKRKMTQKRKKKPATVNARVLFVLFFRRNENWNLVCAACIVIGADPMNLIKCLIRCILISCSINRYRTVCVPIRFHRASFARWVFVGSVPTVSHNASRRMQSTPHVNDIQHVTGCAVQWSFDAIVQILLSTRKRDNA